MHNYRILIFWALVLAAAAWSGPAAWGETWHLEGGEQWKAVSESGRGQYLPAIAEIKKLVDSGDVEAVKEAAAELKERFGEFSGPDWDAFMAAEILYCKGKFVKAVRGYDILLNDYPESDLRQAALERQFSIATAFLNGQKIPLLKVFRMKGYDEGAKVMGRISDRAGDSPIALRAAVSVAESYERRGKYNDAHMEWSFISSRWPAGQTGKEALLNMARCKHAAYRGPKYDASVLVSARSYYQNFKMRYPQDAAALEIDKKLEQVEEQLAYKRFFIGEYYRQTGDTGSANLYYELVTSDWPDSTAAKMAGEKLNE